jgi:hypothetical protein
MTALEAIGIGILIGTMIGMLIVGKMAQRHVHESVGRIISAHLAEPYPECLTLPADFNGTMIDVTVDIVGEPVITTNKIIKECNK